MIGETMQDADAREAVYEETMLPQGFLWQLREGHLILEGAQRLLVAIRSLADSVGNEEHVDRLVIACLFEVPWEMENMAIRLKERDASLGATVSSLADEVREAVHEFLWSGLEKHYRDIE